MAADDPYRRNAIISQIMLVAIAAAARFDQNRASPRGPGRALQLSGRGIRVIR